MKFNMQEIQDNYSKSKGSRELSKWIFALTTFGLGALYLWMTTKIIPEGYIGLRRTATGKLVLLPPGRHSNFPWESYPEQTVSLSKPFVQMGPYKIITVQSGFVAKTFNHGILEILDEGHHLIEDASHTFDSFISIKQETRKLDPITVSTKDNVGLTMQADVRYQITDAALAIKNIDNIETSIKEIAEMNMYQTVGNHSLEDFAPATLAMQHDDTHSQAEHGIMAVVLELKQKLSAHLEKLGITLLNIGITNREFIDKSLAHELAQGAVIKSQADSQRAAAENAAEVKRTQTEAEANSILVLAEAQAKATERKGQAILNLANDFADNPVAQAFYKRSQEVDLVAYAKNSNLFFSQTSETIPGMVLTQSISPSL